MAPLLFRMEFVCHIIRLWGLIFSVWRVLNKFRLEMTPSETNLPRPHPRSTALKNNRNRLMLFSCFDWRFFKKRENVDRQERHLLELEEHEENEDNKSLTNIVDRSLWKGRKNLTKNPNFNWVKNLTNIKLQLTSLSYLMKNQRGFTKLSVM